MRYAGVFIALFLAVMNMKLSRLALSAIVSALLTWAVSTL
jgi:hypothetical protein